MPGRVMHIFIASNAGEPMREFREVRALKGVGLQGDRYAGHLGAWSKSGRSVIRHVSLIEQEAIDRAGGKFLASETRRNIVVAYFPLNRLVGKEFIIGESLMKGIELCDPCQRPSKLSGKDGFPVLFAGFGGLRAEIVIAGTIKVGDGAIYERLCLLCNSVQPLSHDCPMIYGEA